ncbi:PREDICTED: zinc finger protein 664-like [Nicrophorus vespilloides]|uniref:Zinc finger protein 664-like n=1 Tax=Nicrophorus vespilloides TaxID=110193 RepID=A0ABM1MQN2_NICVS|nr:PREDICTED: zinc finger protein 664-like [Nicrophorus vespilloides]
MMEIKLISCPLCLKPHFDGVDTLRLTLIAAATSQITCPVCNESLMGLDKLTIHLFSHITSISKTVPEPVVEAKKEIRCDICNFTFSDENILDMHQKLLHQTQADKKTGIYNYHCHLCSKKFKMRGSLMVHLRVAHYGFGHNDNGLEKLENLVSEAKSKRSLDGKVEESKTSVKQWSCDVCSKLFTTKYFLKKHKRLHTGEMPYFCAQCNKYFTFQQSYHKHMLYHSSEKPHVCAECGRAFKELSTLHNHERIHSGERPFACETCGKCFRQRVSYLVHKRIHTGVMPYKCTACEKTFRYKVSQKSHKCPMNPPGSVVKTNVLESTEVSNADTNGIISPSVNTIVFNSNGEIVGQNFAFDGKSLITYNDIRENKVVDSEKPFGTQNNNADVLSDARNESAFPIEANNQDFFSMVMSPPLPDVESLCLSNSPKSNKQSLHTINEESLKELLYGLSNNVE